MHVHDLGDRRERRGAGHHRVVERVDTGSRQAELTVSIGRGARGQARDQGTVAQHADRAGGGRRPREDEAGVVAAGGAEQLRYGRGADELAAVERIGRGIWQRALVGEQRRRDVGDAGARVERGHRGRRSGVAEARIRRLVQRDEAGRFRRQRQAVGAAGRVKTVAAGHHDQPALVAAFGGFGDERAERGIQLHHRACVVRRRQPVVQRRVLSRVILRDHQRVTVVDHAHAVLRDAGVDRSAVHQRVEIARILIRCQQGRETARIDGGTHRAGPRALEHLKHGAAVRGLVRRVGVDLMTVGPRAGQHGRPARCVEVRLLRQRAIDTAAVRGRHGQLGKIGQLAAGDTRAQRAIRHAVEFDQQHLLGRRCAGRSRRAGRRARADLCVARAVAGTAVAGMRYAATATQRSRCAQRAKQRQAACELHDGVPSHLRPLSMPICAGPSGESLQR